MQAAAGPAAGTPAASGAGDNSSGVVVDELGETTASIKVVEGEVKELTEEIKKVKEALEANAGYLSMQVQELKEYLKGLMKEREQLRRKEEQLREEKAMLMATPPLGELILRPDLLVVSSISIPSHRSFRTSDSQPPTTSCGMPPLHLS
jgi:FtsZ-binding cell division protein ZapB